MFFRIALVSLVLTFCVSCSEQSVPPVKIAINPWPGYEFLYLAEEKGFFQKTGLNAKLIQLRSLADGQRAYINGHVDGMASTVIEAVQAEVFGGEPLKVVMVSDYSDGGDMVVARSEFANMQALRGKKIGCEVSSLGIFILQRALAKSGMSLEDVELVNIEQMRVEKAMNSQELDAVVTYSPVSINLLNSKNYHAVFTSREIPKEIIDIISISEKALKANPEFVSRLHDAWGMALDYYRSNPQDALTIMAEREGITPADFKGVLSDLKIVDEKGQKEIFEPSKGLDKNIMEVCRTLVHVNAISTDCANFPDIVYKRS